MYLFVLNYIIHVVSININVLSVYHICILFVYRFVCIYSCVCVYGLHFIRPSYPYEEQYVCMCVFGCAANRTDDVFGLIASPIVRTMTLCICP